MKILFFILFIQLGIVFYIIMYKRTKDILNPFGISSFLWLFVAAFANLRLSYLQSNWDVEMYFVVFIAAVAIFLAGYLVVPSSSEFYYLKSSVNITKSYKKFTRLFFIISIICSLIEWKNNGYYINLLSQTTGGDLKSGFQAISGVHYGTILLPYFAIYSFFELFFDESKKILSSCYNILVIFIVIFFSYFVLVSRGTLLIIAMAFIYIYHCKYRLKSWKSITLIIIVVLGFLYMSNVRLTSSSLVFTATNNGSMFNAIYTYAAFSFENLNKLVQDGSHYTVICASILQHILQPLNLNKFNIIYYETEFFNATTFVYDFYYDLGVIGVFVYPFIIYLLIGFVYKRTKDDFKYVLVLAAIQKGIFTIFFGNYLSGMIVTVWPTIFTVLVICTLSRPKSSLSQQEKSGCT